MHLLKHIPKFLLCLTILVFFSPKAKAQDPLWGQFYNAPTYTNPGLIGVFNGSFRVVANYRDQWSSILGTHPFRTVSSSFEYRHGVGRNDFFSYGLTILSDEAGPARYSQKSGILGLSYMKKLGGRGYNSIQHYLVAGAQAGLGQHSLKGDRVWFSNQFSEITGEIDYNLPSGENISTSTDPFVDFNAGLVWYAIFDDNKSLYIGGAIHHLTTPDIKFDVSNMGSQVDMKFTGQIGAELPFNRDLSILPSIIAQSQGASFNSIFGANIRYTNRDWHEIAIRIGAWGQTVNNLDSGLTFPSLIFTSILEMNRWQIGFSYDVNASQLQAPTNSRGAFEVSVSYVHPIERQLKVRCPNF